MAKLYVFSRQFDTRFDEPRFTLSVDLMRVISVPYPLNASTMLVCRPIRSLAKPP
jgi:hypothetical protein